MKKILLPLSGVALILLAFLAYYRLQLTQSAPQAEPSIPAITMENSPSPGMEVSYEFMATKSGVVALDLIQQLAEIETKDFGAAGKFVTSINDLAADDGHYWGFYVNDQYAQQGVSQTVLQEGDKIRFTYEVIDPTQR